jgi:hypothetical protein
VPVLLLNATALSSATAAIIPAEPADGCGTGCESDLAESGCFVRDVASFGAGKWRQKIEQALAASKACVAFLGRRWADATNLPRLQDPNDMVRHELESALASADQEVLTVIPPACGGRPAGSDLR